MVEKAKQAVKYISGCFFLILIAFIIYLFISSTFFAGGGMQSEALSAATKITEYDEDTEIGHRFFEIGGDGCDIMFEDLPDSFTIQVPGIPLADYQNQQVERSALVPKILTSGEVRGSFEWGDLIPIGVFLLFLPMGIFLLSGITFAFMCLFNRSQSLWDSLDDFLSGLAMSFLPLLFCYLVGIFLIDNVVLYVDNASDSDYRVTVDGGSPIPLLAKSHVRLVIIPGGYLTPRFGETIVSLIVRESGGSEEPIEGAMLKVLPRSIYVYNIGGLNTYHFRTGVYK